MFENNYVQPSVSEVLRKREQASSNTETNAFLAKLKQEQKEEIKRSRATKRSKGVKKTIEINPQTFEQTVIYSRV